VSLLEITDLTTAFRTGSGQVTAVEDISLTLDKGEILGIVGESGSGKSVTALAVMGLLPKPAARILGGSIMFEGRDLLALSDRSMQRLRGPGIAMVFQEPMTSLNPVFTIGEQIMETIRAHESLSQRDAFARAVEMLEKVGIPSAPARMSDYPHQLSGGQRQRVMLAIALVCRPRLLIADEPTTALDVTIQAQILDLLIELRQRLSMALVLVTHDMGVVARMADRITVMYAGRVCETADAATLFRAPQHPYTRALLESMPRLDHSYAQGKRRLPSISGRPPDLLHSPLGCRFYARCPEAEPDCARILPRAHAVAPGHMVSCLRRGSPAEAA
jgi:peptide/nickel transport system ATP-binding protein/oligopeptide transport system ATP-binding protein